MKELGERTSSTYESIASSLEQKPKYDFTILKELIQNEGGITNSEATTNDDNNSPLQKKRNKIIANAKDEDQCIYFEVSGKCIVIRCCIQGWIEKIKLAGIWNLK